MIRLYWLDVESLNDETLFRHSLAQLSEHRQKKALTFRFPKDRSLSLGAGLLLDHGLRVYGLREREMVYGSTGQGKPCFTNAPEIRFNLSHSGTKVLAAFSDGEVGCDVEEITAVDLKIAKRFFHADEYAALLEAASPAAREELFFRLWTLKESFLKATGLGLTLPLSAFAIRLEEGSIRVEHQLDDSKWHFAEYGLLPGYRCALCAEETCSGVMPEQVKNMENI